MATADETSCIGCGERAPPFVPCRVCKTHTCVPCLRRAVRTNPTALPACTGECRPAQVFDTAYLIRTLGAETVSELYDDAVAQLVQSQSHVLRLVEAAYSAQLRWKHALATDKPARQVQFLKRRYEEAIRHATAAQLVMLSPRDTFDDLHMDDWLDDLRTRVPAEVRIPASNNADQSLHARYAWCLLREMWHRHVSLVRRWSETPDQRAQQLYNVHFRYARNKLTDAHYSTLLISLHRSHHKLAAVDAARRHYLTSCMDVMERLSRLLVAKLSQPCWKGLNKLRRSYTRHAAAFTTALDDVWHAYDGEVVSDDRACTTLCCLNVCVSSQPCKFVIARAFEPLFRHADDASAQKRTRV